jgi:hypothetical protein
LVVASTPLTVTAYGPDTGESPAGEAAPVVNVPEAFTGPPPVEYATNAPPSLAADVGEFTLPS